MIQARSPYAEMLLAAIAAYEQRNGVRFPNTNAIARFLGCSWQSLKLYFETDRVPHRTRVIDYAEKLGANADDHLRAAGFPLTSDRVGVTLPELIDIVQRAAPWDDVYKQSVLDGLRQATRVADPSWRSAVLSVARTPDVSLLDRAQRIYQLSTLFDAQSFMKSA